MAYNMNEMLITGGTPVNTRQLQYAVLLSKVRSFSQAAEALHISQPSLSKQIISLEEELGVRLFERTAPLTLTPAGEYFVAKAEKLLADEDQMLKTIDKYRSGENGRLTIGVSPFRSLYLMPRFIRQLKQRFPHLQVILREAGSEQLHKGILEGQYDFAIMNLPVDESLLDVIPLEQDRLILAVPDEMLCHLDPQPAAPDIPLDLSACATLPFIALSQQQELRQQFRHLCTLAGLEPDVQVEVVGIATAWSLVQAGVGAAVLPQQFVQSGDFRGVTLFPILQQAPTRQPAIITRRGQYISRFSEHAIRLLKSL